MYLIDTITLEVIAEVDQEWVDQHKELWLDGTLADMGLEIVPWWPDESTEFPPKSTEKNLTS